MEAAQPGQSLYLSKYHIVGNHVSRLNANTHSYWRLFKNFVVYLQAISPCRIQSVISFNTGAVFETAYSIVSPFLNEKVRNRVS